MWILIGLKSESCSYLNSFHLLSLNPSRLVLPMILSSIWMLHSHPASSLMSGNCLILLARHVTLHVIRTPNAVKSRRKFVRMVGAQTLVLFLAVILRSRIGFGETNLGLLRGCSPEEIDWCAWRLGSDCEYSVCRPDPEGILEKRPWQRLKLSIVLRLEHGAQRDLTAGGFREEVANREAPACMS